MNKPVTTKARTLAATATLIGTVNGIPFYESPTMGDESPLLMINEEGKVKRTSFWELPTLDIMTGELNA
jgi:hypothetical protein